MQTTRTELEAEIRNRIDEDLKRYLTVIRKWWWLIVISVGVAGGSAYFAARSMPPAYMTALTVMVGESAANPNISIDQMTTSQRLADAYAGMIRRQPILEATVESLGLPVSWLDLQSRVSVSRVGGPQFIEVRVIDSDRQRTKVIADEIATQLIKQSPTADYTLQMESRLQFVRHQLDSLQESIQQAEAAIAEKQAAIKTEVSARAVLDRQDEIQALMLNLSGWRTTYASLLSSTQTTRAPNFLTVIEPAFVPNGPIAPDVRAYVLMAVAMGLLLSLAGAFLIEYFNDTLGTSEDVSRVLGLPTIGSLVDMGQRRSAPESRTRTVTLHDPDFEGYRVLRTGVQFSCADERQVMVLVTSPGLQEGKSVTSANLATSFALAGMRTLLVDVDLRRPTAHTFFGVTNEVGLTTLFLDDQSGRSGHRVQVPVTGTHSRQRQSQDRLSRLKEHLQSCVVATDTPGLSLLPSGPKPVNPTELLGADRMDELIRVFRETFDVVVFDGPPTLPVADAVVMASRDIGVLLVVQAGRTRSPAALQTKKSLTRVGARILGVVVNRVPKASMSYYYEYGGPVDKPGLKGALRRLFKKAAPNIENELAVAKASRGVQMNGREP